MANPKPRENLQLKLLEITVLIHTTGGSILFGLLGLSNKFSAILNNFLLAVMFAIAIGIFIYNFGLFRKCFSENMSKIDNNMLDETFTNAIIMIIFLLIINLSVQLETVGII